MQHLFLIAFFVCAYLLKHWIIANGGLYEKDNFVIIGDENMRTACGLVKLEGEGCPAT